MKENLNVHGLWRQRNESFDEVTDNAYQMLTQLATIYPEWKNWYRFYKTIAESKNPRKILSGNREEIKDEFLSKQHVSEDGTIDKSFGYRLHAYSGHLPLWNASEISICCCVQGYYQPFNNIALKIPQFPQFLPCNENVNKMAQAVEYLAKTWDTDWLSIRISIESAHEPLWHGAPIFGWINYLSPRIGTLTTLPDGWHWWKGNKKCSKIFVFNEGLPSKNKPEDIEKIERLISKISWNKK
ncbi:MAG: hypothetical protein LBL62_03820 [Planctomycetaceae bacterium]|jgi:hypothetical protein|nr:hypothetical protein [Planctomycetaceae bacterium]